MMDSEDLRDSDFERDEPDEEVGTPAIELKETDSNTEVNQQGNRPNRTNATRKTAKRRRSGSGSPLNQIQSENQIQPKKSWRSANAFINFVQNFKEDNPDPISGKNLFKVCGERWKTMTNEEKQPYISAANTVKRLKNRKTIDCTDQLAKKTCTRLSKRKAEIKRKKSNKKRSQPTLSNIITVRDTESSEAPEMSDPEYY